ncbi:P83/100 family protein [Borrelia hermsii]|uniref:P83/100 family protein n=1 Tax=Borrelia hermsii TaxID=140 RepID=UPI0005D78111|nr:P83/100 family protein [Borrelia hermsii]AJW73656.1 P83/100 antigen [Borrelia hermsii CC1]
MKRIWILFNFLFIFLNIFTFHAREVDKKKLKDFVNMDLEFVNYRGPYDSTDTYLQIVGIGEFLAKNLTNNKSNYYSKYYVNRYIDSESEKSSSDVFIIGESSSLDSILNLRRILTGYLMEGFNYSKESAELLAKAITIYNATYRGDLDYYSDAYIQPALEGLSKHNVGLSRVYSQWAGKTYIFVPLKRNILSGNIESDVDLDKIVTDKVVISLLSENEEVGTDFARDLTDVQDEIRDVDQEKIDIESATLKSIDDELTETIDNLREQLERATDDAEKEGIKKQIDDKTVKRDALKDKTDGLKKSQKKLDSSQEKLDRQRDAVKDKVQESIDKGNKDKNLPKPGAISSPKVDEKLQLIETIEDLEEQLERATDDAEKEIIKKQIDDKLVKRDALKDKTDGPKELQRRLDGQRDAAEDKVQEGINKGKRDNNLPKPREVNLLKKDEKLKSASELKNQLKRATDDAEKEIIKKQIDDKLVKRDALKDKTDGPKELQRRLDGKRDAAEDKVQEGINKGKRDNNLPKPREVNLLKKDEKLKSASELKNQLKRATDDAEKEIIKKQIDDKLVKRDALKDKTDGPKELQRRLDGKRDAAEDKVQEGINKGKRDNNLPKPREVSLLKKDEKLKSASELKKQPKRATADISKNIPSVVNNQSRRLPAKPLAFRKQSDQSEGVDKLPLETENQKPIHKPMFLEVLNPNTNLGVLRLIDSDGGQLEEASRYGIRRYGVYERKDDFVAIKLCSGIAKLQLLNKAENLKVESEADFELSRDSSLYVDSKMILVVVKDNNVWKLAKFSSKDLSEFILSEDEVLPFTSFTVDAGHVYLQDASKKLITLDLNTLKKVS